MASSLPSASATAVAAASISKTTSSSPSLPFKHRHFSHSKVSFCLSSKPKLRFATKSLPSHWNHSTVVKAQLNEVRFWLWFSFKDLVSVFHSLRDMFLEPSVAFKVALDGSANATATIPATESTVPASEEKDDKPVNEPLPAALATEESVSEFLTQVASLVKLVDSRDIVEFQLKQLGCELIIRKKEALPQPPSPEPVFMMHHPSSPPAVMPSAFSPAPAPTPSAPAPSSTSTPAPSPPAAKSANSSFPRLKCPMAGTFYRSPGPGEPPFVKVGDKVQKGQIMCIIEAMKLMNEIEADQSGTIVEILVDDGKPVSVDIPLFVIQP